MVELTQVEYGGWATNHKLTNGKIELVIAGEVGPRVLHLALAGGDNQFYNDPAAMGKGSGDDWRLYGGHRFWHAPEDDPRSYQPDNDPVNVEQFGALVRVEQPTEPKTGMMKTLDFEMATDAAHVRVTHRLTNTNMWAITCAPWALSVMAPGGVGIIPQPPRGTHPEALLPANSLTLWAYTDMTDPRWTWGQKYILLKQDSSATTPQKIGADVPDGWAAHVNNGTLFVKRFTKQQGATYPDLGCTVETFTNDFMLELETLGPLQSIPPGGSIEHVEDWYLFPDVSTPTNDSDVDEHILPHVYDAKPSA